MFHLVVVVVVGGMLIRGRAKYRADAAEIFTEDRPSTLVMRLSCIA